jgi:L-malate glycosyltransferase
VRIAAIIYLAPRKLGSLEQWVMEFAEECRRRGHQVHLFCGEPVHPVVEERLRVAGVGWTPYRLLENRPIQWGRKLRRSFDLIYTNLVVPQSPLAYAGYLAWPLPVCFFDAISGPMPGQRPARWIRRKLDPFIFSRVARLGACSHYVLERDIRRFRLERSRGEVFYNGVDTTRFCPRGEARGEPVRIAAVANLIPEKGIDILLKACAELQELSWRLTIVGDGRSRKQLEALASTLGLGGRAEFVGLRDDVEAILQDAEIYVHPCLWEEAFGLTIAEAMACGCAVVASRIGGIPEIIEDGRSGILVERGDVRELSQVLRALLLDGPRRRSLGAEARARVVERFGLRSAVDRQVDWIERSVKR